MGLVPPCQGLLGGVWGGLDGTVWQATQPRD